LAGPETHAQHGDVGPDGDLVDLYVGELVTRTGLNPATAAADHPIDLAEHLRAIAKELARVKGNPCRDA
jgi:hypothetical protein